MEENKGALGEGYTKNAKGWYKNDNGEIFGPKEKQKKLATGLHQATHMGRETLRNFTKHLFDGIGIRAILQKAHKSCAIHARVNPEDAL